MENTFGRELEKKIEFGMKLGEFKDLILYTLEDYLFQTKFNDKVTNLNIPSLGIKYTVTERYALDLRGFFNIPQISFDGKGCIYNNGREGAYVSPEFFAKCFVERVFDVWTALSKLYLPKFLMEEETKSGKVNFDMPDDVENDNNKEKSNNETTKYSHMDFVETYNSLVNLKKINNALSQGLVGIVRDLNVDINTITFLRKLEFAAKFQKDVEFVLDKMIKEQYEEELFDFSNEDFYKSEEYKKLKKEHEKLFRIGPFIAPLEQEEWETKGKSYDYGTDEERENWKKRYEKLKSDFEKEGLVRIKENISQQSFSLSEIKKNLVDYWKVKIYTYNYPKNVGYNPFINELGLDQIGYYAHPADKYIPERIYGRRMSEEYMEEIEAYDYNDFYGSYPSDSYRGI